MSEADASQTTLQERVDADDRLKKFGTFAGVFRPTVMTIVGVIMFVREGWVIGNAGLVGGLLIICLGFAIVTLTALSMSCIVTNLRIGAGGAYSIISQSLGLEVGGSVGIPLYLAQAFAATMYVFGFREGLMWVVGDVGIPYIPEVWLPFALDLVSFALMFGIAWISTSFAFRVQYVVLAFMIAGIASFVGIVFTPDALVHEPQLWGDFPGAPENGFQGASFWIVFAIFFPAATGVMAGANLSGELKDPRRAIPRGTLAAIATSFVIYVVLAVLLSMAVPVEELTSNYTAMIDYAVWPPAVLGALLGATFSSALASIVGAPRIMQALGNHGILPKSSWFARRKNGEPKNALYVTGAIVFLGILIRDLNAIAPMITMFFLITYMMINLVVLVEQSLDMVSFRPVFPVPIWVPALGTLGCLVTMFIISPVVSLVSVAVVFGVYIWLTRRHLNAPHGDIRSGLFVSLAEWAAKHTYDLPTSNERAWKPNLLIPFREHREIRGMFNLIRDITHPKGSLTLVALTPPGGDDELERSVPRLGYAFMEEGVFARWTTVESVQAHRGIIAGMQTLAGTFFRPNILFMRVPDDDSEEEGIRRVVDKARNNNVGVQMFLDEPVAGLGQRQVINVWVRDQSPEWSLTMDLGNIDLALLTAHKLRVNWNAKIRLITAIEDESEIDAARKFLQNLLTLARMPHVEIVIETGSFFEALEAAPQADLDLLGLPDDLRFEFLRTVLEKRQAACLFVADSGDENILA